jgi:hypothetical protein
MSDRAAVALAVAIALGAHVGGGPTPVLGALLVVVAVLARRPWLLCLAAALLAAGLADRARAGLDPVGAGPFGPAWVTLAGDPVPLDSEGIRVDVTAGGRRLEAVAHGPPAWALEERLAGERVAVTGRLRPPPAPTPCAGSSPAAPRDFPERTARSSPVSSSATTASSRPRWPTTSGRRV